MKLSLNQWLHICLINLGIVSILGVIMRYKIGFYFPFVDQKNLQLGHFHFAFSGWIGQLLMVFMTRVYGEVSNKDSFARYHRILLFNLLNSYGLLVSYYFQGYGHISLIFTSCSILINIIFIFNISRDILKSPKDNFSKWFYAAFLFNLTSVFGIIYLVIMMLSHSVEQHSYLASLYWYLHFQYNGWFLFACFGFFTFYLYELRIPIIIESKYFWILALSCIPTYGLSTLWVQLPNFVYIIVILAALAQCFAWFAILIKLKKYRFLAFLKERTERNLFRIIGLALSLKIILQTISVFPQVSKFAFGFRPIVIAYLHLVFLLIISLFLISYSLINKFLMLNKLTKIGVNLFVIGIILNELVLAIQGFASFAYIALPWANTFLFIFSVMIAIGISFLLRGHHLSHIKLPLQKNESIFNLNNKL